jgi:hypothetical protein
VYHISFLCISIRGKGCILLLLHVWFWFFYHFKHIFIIGHKGTIFSQNNNSVSECIFFFSYKNVALLRDIQYGPLLFFNSTVHILYLQPLRWNSWLQNDRDIRLLIKLIKKSRENSFVCERIYRIFLFML